MKVNRGEADLKLPDSFYRLETYPYLTLADGTSLPMSQIPPSQMRRLRSNHRIPLVGRPCCFAITDDREILLYPKPDQDYDVTLTYTEHPRTI